MLLGLVAFVGSLLLTALLCRLARRWGFVDQPGGHSTHTEPTALGGGIALFWSIIAPLGLVCALVQWVPADRLPPGLAVHIDGLLSRTPQLLVLIAAAAVLHVTGLIDDKRALGPAVKLGAQLAVAIAVATVGQIRFDFFIPSPAISTALSVLWIVVIINAFNFLDNMDGLSAGTAAICAAMILTAALRSQQVFVSALLALLIGALLGFLVFNFAPAKIFMGDAGSLLAGLLLAVATIRTTYYHQGSPAGRWFAACMPLIVLAVPLYDFTSVTILRLRQGKSPFVGDKQHFSHRLVNLGMTTRQAVLTIYLATACTGLAACFLHQVSTTGVILIFVQTLMIVMIIAVLEHPWRRRQ